MGLFLFEEIPMNSSFKCELSKSTKAFRLDEHAGILPARTTVNVGRRCGLIFFKWKGGSGYEGAFGALRCCGAFIPPCGGMPAPHREISVLLNFPPFFLFIQLHL